MYGILDQHVEYEHLRAALRYVIGTCGVARIHIAREVGIPDRSLRDFLRGAEPSPTNLRRLWAWHVGEDVPVSADAEHGALSVLVSGLPLACRAAVRERMVRHLRRAVLRHGDALPRWLDREVAGWHAMRRYRRR